MENEILGNLWSKSLAWFVSSDRRSGLGDDQLASNTDLAPSSKRVSLLVVLERGLVDPESPRLKDRHHPEHDSEKKVDLIQHDHHITLAGPPLCGADGIRGNVDGLSFSMTALCLPLSEIADGSGFGRRG